jgi:predicted tellurium resistance membrane protein TerC
VVRRRRRRGRGDCTLGDHPWDAALELLSDPQAWIAFLTLTALELVLGIDNIIFISILVDRPPGSSS